MNTRVMRSQSNSAVDKPNWQPADFSYNPAYALTLTPDDQAELINAVRKIYQADANVVTLLSSKKCFRLIH